VATETILLVEDNPDDVELALLGFSRNNPQSNHAENQYVIEVARNGEEALDYLFASGKHRNRCPTRDPNLILLDVKLPGISGLKVLQKIRNHPNYQHTPVVILTTSDETSDIVEGYNLGVNSYLQKPVNFNAFVELLQQIGQYWLRNNITPPKSESSLSSDNLNLVENR